MKNPSRYVDGLVLLFLVLAIDEFDQEWMRGDRWLSIDHVHLLYLYYCALGEPTPKTIGHCPLIIGKIIWNLNGFWQDLGLKFWLNLRAKFLTKLNLRAKFLTELGAQFVFQWFWSQPSIYVLTAEINSNTYHHGRLTDRIRAGLDFAGSRLWLAVRRRVFLVGPLEI